MACENFWVSKQWVDPIAWPEPQACSLIGSGSRITSEAEVTVPFVYLKIMSHCFGYSDLSCLPLICMQEDK